MIYDAVIYNSQNEVIDERNISSFSCNATCGVSFLVPGDTDYLVSVEGINVTSVCKFINKRSP